MNSIAPFRGEVYFHYNPVSQKGYVGQTIVGVVSRWKDHVKHAYLPKSAGFLYPFARAIRKYGPDAFEHQVLSSAHSRAELDNLEKIWIILLQSRESGYNLATGGEGNPGLKHTAEAKAKMSRNRTGKALGLTFNRGRNASAETCYKRGASNRGKKFSAEHKEKIRQTRIGVPRPDVTAWNNLRWANPESHRRASELAKLQRARELAEKYHG